MCRCGPVPLVSDGLVLSTKLAKLLGVKRGERVIVEVLEGRRPVREVVVSDLVEEYLGTSVYMELGALHRFMREGQNLSGAYLTVDSLHATELYDRLKQTTVCGGCEPETSHVAEF